jgi:hypothetical protein
VYMNGRTPVDSVISAISESVQKPEMEASKQAGAFLEWLRLRREAARLQMQAGA